MQSPFIHGWGCLLYIGQGGTTTYNYKKLKNNVKRVFMFDIFTSNVNINPLVNTAKSIGSDCKAYPAIKLITYYTKYKLNA